MNFGLKKKRDQFDKKNNKNLMNVIKIKFDNSLSDTYERPIIPIMKCDSPIYIPLNYNEDLSARWEF